MKFSIITSVVSFWMLSIGFTDCFAQRKGQMVDGIIAKVDDEVILLSEWEASYRQIVAQGQPESSTLKCEVLQSILVNKMLLAKAVIDSITVESEEVDAQLDRRMQYFISTFGSKEKLEKYYNKTTDQLKDELRKEVKDQMLSQKVEDGITSGVKVSPKEVKQFFQQIPKDSLPYLPAEVEVAQLVIIPKASPQAKTEARLALLDIKERIVKGESFAELAKMYSEDPGSAIHGGDLGFWERGSMVAEFEAAAFKLEPGKMSEVVESMFGFHLIRLEERQGDKYRASHILIKPKNTEGDMSYSIKFLDSLRKEIQEGKMTFSKAVKDYSEDEQSKNNGGFVLDQATNTSRIPTDRLNSSIYFALDTMKVGQISSPLPYRMEDGKQALRLLYFKNKIPPHYANLEDDYQKLQILTLNRKKEQILDEWFDKTRQQEYIFIDKDYVDCENLNDI